jgi:hypothetical protein
VLHPNPSVVPEVPRRGYVARCEDISRASGTFLASKFMSRLG